MMLLTSFVRIVGNKKHYINKKHNNMNKENTPSLRSALQLAGKLALAAKLVTTSNAKNLSERIEAMDNALNAYDIEIMSISNNKDLVCSAGRYYNDCHIHNNNEHGCDECGNYKPTDC